MKDDLLIKYLTGNASDTEVKEVESWLHQDPEHEVRLEELRQTWSLTAVDINVNTEQAWNQLRSRIEGPAPHRRGVVRSLISNPVLYFASAAAILIALFIINQTYQPTLRQTLAGNEVLSDQVLSDGSTFSLQSGSKLSYPEQFDATERVVDLEGEAFFEIEKDSTRPFVVRMRKARVKVLGTAFNLRETPDSLVLTVTEGRVVFQSSENLNESGIFTAGEQGVLHYATGRIRRDIATAPDALFWYNKSLLFSATPLVEVLETLEKHYEVIFEYRQEEINDCLLTTRFEGEELSDIILVIESTFNIKFQVSDNHYQVIANENKCKEHI